MRNLLEDGRNSNSAFENVQNVAKSAKQKHVKKTLSNILQFKDKRLIHFAVTKRLRF